MKFKKRILCLFLMITLCVTGCSNISIPTNINAAFKNFTHCLFLQEVSSNTINLHYSLKNPEKYGITNTPITLGNYDFDMISTMASIENWESGLQKFSYNQLSDENQLTYDILSYYFNSLRTSTEYYLYQEPLTPVTGIHAQLPILLAEYTFSCEEDVITYLKLLNTLPDYFASISRFEQKKAEAGLFMSDELADAVIKQCNAFVSMGHENYLLSTFKERIGSLDSLSEQSRSDYIQKNQEQIFSDVVPSYEALAISIASLKGSGNKTRGICHLLDGKEYYMHLVATETGSSRSIQALQSLIQKQITSDLSSCQKIVIENPDILEATSEIKENPENIMKNLRNKIKTSFPASLLWIMTGSLCFCASSNCAINNSI